MEHTYVKNGRMVTQSRDRGNEIPLLEGHVYSILFNPEIGFYLTEQEPMVRPSKVYGNTEVRAQKVFNTFVSRQGKNTGVLLSGDKGSGKTLLARELCIMANEVNIPVLVLDAAYAGPNFIEFINNITQPCVIFIDEFEKKYEKTEEQNSLLSLLDGTGTNNKMYLLTSNSEKVSEFLLSRPSRIFYHYRYGKIDEEVMVGYCKDNLKNQAHLENLQMFWAVSSNMSFDVLQSVVEELNRYPEQTFFNTVRDMNIDLGNALARHYTPKTITFDGVDMSTTDGPQRFNIVDILSGTSEARIPLDLNSDFEKGIAIRKHFPGTESWWYNSTIMEKFEKGEMDYETACDEMSDEITVNLKYDPMTDKIRGDVMNFRRNIQGRDLVIEYKALKGNPIEEYFRRLFD